MPGRPTSSSRGSPTSVVTPETARRRCRRARRTTGPTSPGSARRRLPIGARAREYWLRRLDGQDDLRYGTVAGPQDRGSYVAHHFPLVIPASRTRALRALSQHNNATLATTLLSLLAVRLHDLSGATDIAVGIPVGGRPDRRFEQCVGFFMNAVALRVDLAANPHFSSLLSTVRAAFIDAYEHRDLPYECVLQTRGARDHVQPPFRVVLNVNRGQRSDGALPGLQSNEMAATRATRSFADLSLHIRDGGSQLSCCLLYQRARFSEREVHEIAGGFLRLLDAVQRHPEARLHQMTRTHRRGDGLDVDTEDVDGSPRRLVR